MLAGHVSGMLKSLVLRIGADSAEWNHHFSRLDTFCLVSGKQRGPKKNKKGKRAANSGEELRVQLLLLHCPDLHRPWPSSP